MLVGMNGVIRLRQATVRAPELSSGGMGFSFGSLTLITTVPAKSNGDTLRQRPHFRGAMEHSLAGRRVSETELELSTVATSLLKCM